VVVVFLLLPVSGSVKAAGPVSFQLDKDWNFSNPHISDRSWRGAMLLLLANNKAWLRERAQ
jgi:hypothetical protein